VPLASLVIVIAVAGCVVTPTPNGSGSAAVSGTSMEAVVSRTFTAYGFELESGTKLPDMTLAFETYGTLAPDGRNVILVTHGFTSSHHAAGKYTPTGAPGWWDGLIGPGKTVDTNRYFVVASNMLGSSYGSTAPASVNPATGKQYGPDFPTITLRDIVRAQKLLLESLGVHHLVAVAGPSFGGYQAFQWAVQYPDFMECVVPVVTAPKTRAGAGVEELVNVFARDPNWNGGWHYDRGGIPATMTAMRVSTSSGTVRTRSSR
jgi:homoserine O-acetyltransferase